MTRPKLLLADDSVTIRKVVELTFADEGIEVSTVADADAAMLKFVEIQPDIVLVDVGLTGTNGYRICEMIKHDEATKHIPVILLVGSFEPFDQDQAERCKADSVLTKPFHSIRELVTGVWDLLGGKPVDETEGFETEPNPVKPETADIENLYESSFHQTVKMDEFDTVDDLLGDSGMDDDMIEASYPTEAYTANFPDLSSGPEAADQTKDFDWSPESIVTDKTAEPIEKPPFEPKFVFDESDDHDDESIHEAETITSGYGSGRANAFDLDLPPAPVAAVTGSEHVTESNFETDEAIELATVESSVTGDNERSDSNSFFVNAADEVAEPLVDRSWPLVNSLADDEIGETVNRQPAVAVNQRVAELIEDDGAVLDLHISQPRGDKSAAVPPIELDDLEHGDFLSSLVGEGSAPTGKLAPDTETLISEPGSEHGAAESHDANSGDERESTKPSPEYIAMIAQCVVEHLSDRVIREIARDVVPRIAEKLIREALDDENKS